MQNLIGVRVADAAERARIGERAFQRVILGGQSRAEFFERRLEHFETTRVLRLQRLAAAEYEKRCATLRACLGQRERAGVEREDGECRARATLGACGKPVQPARDHQVENEPVVALEANGYPLPDAAECNDAAAVQRAERRVERAQQ